MSDYPQPYGRYVLLEPLAQGGMAEVFLAKSLGAGGFERQVVIKRIRPGMVHQESTVTNFVREARLSALLSHPNIVQIYDLDQVDDEYFIAMEYIHGRDLIQTLRQLRGTQGRLPLEHTLYIMACVARGLDYAHSIALDGTHRGIVHRDVSPHNIALSFQGEVKLLDFGIARIMGSVESGEGAAGKVAYMSPEQSRGEPLDGRSDLFSCGAVLFEMLTGRRLFQHPDAEEKLRLLRQAEVPDPRQWAPDLDDTLCDLLMKTLSRDREERFPSAYAFEGALRDYMYNKGLRSDAASLGSYLRELYLEEHSGSASRELLRMASRLMQTPNPAETASQESAPSMEEATPSPDAIAERKPIVSLVVELIGSTQLTETLSAVALQEQQRTCSEQLAQLIARYHGRVHQLDSQGCVALFGLPRTQEDDLARALSCALAMMRWNRSKEGAATGVQFAMGVHRGEVSVVGRPGFKARVLPRGDVVRLAIQLANMASTGSILLSSTTARLAQQNWRLRPGPSLSLRGSQREPSFDLVGWRALSLQKASWIPRGSELEAIGDALKKLSQGLGTQIFVLGDAGCGKSHLLQSLQQQARTTGVRWILGKSHPGLPATLRLLLRQILAQLETARARPAQDLMEGIDAVLPQARERSESLEQLAQRCIGALKKQGREGPLIIGIDDYHTYPFSEQRLINQLTHASRALPILWLITSRHAHLPEGARPEKTLRLEMLSALGQRQLLEHLLGVKKLGPRLLRSISLNTEGRPLFITEMVRSLLEKKQIQIDAKTSRAELSKTFEQPDLPSSLESLVGARVDALTPEAKSALQIAALQGSTVDILLFRRMLTRAGSYESALEDLLTHGLLLESEDHYMFSSQLLWSAVVNSILGPRRQEIHTLIADALLEETRLEEDSRLTLLMRHNEGAKRYAEAARHAVSRARRLLQQTSLSSAGEVVKRGLVWLAKFQEEGNRLRGLSYEVEAELHLLKGRVHALQSEHRVALRHLEIASEMIEEGGLSRLSLECLLEQGKIFSSLKRHLEAQACLELGLEEAQQKHKTSEVVFFLIALSALERDRDRIDQAHALAAQAMECASDAGPLAAARAFISMGSQLVRRRPQVRDCELLLSGLRLAQAHRDRLLEGQALNNLGIYYYLTEDYPEALGYFRAALACRQGSGYPLGQVINLINLGMLYLQTEQPGHAVSVFSEASQMAHDANLERLEVRAQLFLNYLAALQGEERAVQSLQRASQAADRLQETESLLVARWLMGALTLRSHPAEGRARLEEVLAEAEQRQTHWLARVVRQELDHAR